MIVVLPCLYWPLNMYLLPLIRFCPCLLAKQFSGAHTDYGKTLKFKITNDEKDLKNHSQFLMFATGLLTLVNQDEDITALQVRNLSGEWISAPPIPGTFVCNIGDMLKPNYDAAVEPLEVCVQRSGGTPKFEKAVYGEHLVSKVQTNFVM
ncbi:hypothetical protein POUND7_014023 [Theobroma cacao]